MDAENNFKPDFVYFLPKHVSRLFNILFAGTSQALIFRALLDDLKVLTNYAVEIAWRS